MARPPCCRRIAGRPAAYVFKPAGVPGRALEEVAVTLDEFEAVRLADLEGLYQEQAAERMAVSRATFGRILESAHRKIADALVSGKLLKIEGGNVRMAQPRADPCPRCSGARSDEVHCPLCHGERHDGTEPPSDGGCRRRRRMRCDDV